MTDDGGRGGGERVRLRPVRREDLGWMAAMAADPRLVGDHNWAGEPRSKDDLEATLLEQFEADGIPTTRIVELDESTPIGEVSWRLERWGPSARSACPAIGIALLPEHRGRGFGTIAQRLLVDHLFESDPLLHRVQSDTAADNPAEQRALEKVGFVVEGWIRDAEYRDGGFHDHVVCSILRREWAQTINGGDDG